MCGLCNIQLLVWYVCGVITVKEILIVVAFGAELGLTVAGMAHGPDRINALSYLIGFMVVGFLGLIVTIITGVVNDRNSKVWYLLSAIGFILLMSVEIALAVLAVVKGCCDGYVRYTLVYRSHITSGVFYAILAMQTATLVIIVLQVHRVYSMYRGPAPGTTSLRIADLATDGKPKSYTILKGVLYLLNLLHVVQGFLLHHIADSRSEQVFMMGVLISTVGVIGCITVSIGGILEMFMYRLSLFLLLIAECFLLLKNSYYTVGALYILSAFCAIVIAIILHVLNNSSHFVRLQTAVRASAEISMVIDKY